MFMNTLLQTMLSAWVSQSRLLDGNGRHMYMCRSGRQNHRITPLTVLFSDLRDTQERSRMEALLEILSREAKCVEEVIVGVLGTFETY